MAKKSSGFKLRFSKSLVGAAIFALALWLYTSLSSTYITYVKVPLNINLLESRAIASPVPRHISVEVRGKGWDLFNLIFFNTSKAANINLTGVNSDQEEITVDRNTLIKSVEFLGDVQPIDVVPQSMSFATGEVKEKTITIKPKIKLMPKDGFTVVGDIRIYPETITIRGNSQIIDSIENWETEQVVFTELKRNFDQYVLLSDERANIIRLSKSKIRVRADIQQVAEITIPDVRIRIRNGVLPENSILVPGRIDAVIRSGVETIQNIDMDQVSAYVNYSDLLNDKNGIIPLYFDLPRNVKLISPHPAYVYHYKRYSVKSLSGL